MRIYNYNIKNVTKDYIFHKSFGISITHKYWYLWNIMCNFIFFKIGIEICRTDWNKTYKTKCANYNKSCKHNMECNECMVCYTEKE